MGSHKKYVPIYAGPKWIKSPKEEILKTNHSVVCKKCVGSRAGFGSKLIVI